MPGNVLRALNPVLSTSQVRDVMCHLLQIVFATLLLISGGVVGEFVFITT